MINSPASALDPEEAAADPAPDVAPAPVVAAAEEAPVAEPVTAGAETASEAIPLEGEVWVTQLDEAGTEYAAEGVTLRKGGLDRDQINCTGAGRSEAEDRCKRT